jgi:hypothetical protein
MPKQKSVSKFGATFPEGYIRANTVAIDYVNGIGHGTFATFVSAAAAQAGAEPLEQRSFSLALAEVQVLLTTDEFNMFYADAQALELDMYLIASKVRDLKTGYTRNEDGTYSDSGGNPVSEAEATTNIFEGAVDVE